MQNAGPANSGRTTRSRVRLVDSFMRVFITAGGLGVIVAVLAIMAYLVNEAWPLFRPGRVTEAAPTQRSAAPDDPLRLFVDEYVGLGAIIDRQAGLSLIDLHSGRTLRARDALAPGEITAVSRPMETGAVALGLADGSVQVGSIGFASEILTGEDLPADVPADAHPGARLSRPDGSYLELTPERQWRRTALAVDFGAPTALPVGNGPIRRIDYRAGSTTQFLVALRDDGTAVFNRVSVSRPLGGGKPRSRLSSEPVSFKAPPGHGVVPDWFFVTSDGEYILAVWSDGLAQRYARIPGAEGFDLAEQVPLVPPGRTVAAADMLIGSLTLMLGLDDGSVRGVFVARANAPETPDGRKLVVAHEFESEGGSAASVLATGQRDRSFAVGDEAGRVVFHHMTSQKRIALAAFDPPAPVALVAVSPKNDALVALTRRGDLGVWRIDPGHPEASVLSLFGRVWYEGDASPSFIYQSSAGEDSAETKLSLVPLIFGTLKATVYALLFAVPIAILAAIYTSELLHPRVRSTVKPLIEMMASLPSVVLGFVAAMVVAPIARDFLPSILIAFGVVPVVLLLGAYVWQLVPVRIASRLRTGQHLLLVIGLVLGGIGVSLALGPVVQRALFTPSDKDVLVLAGSFEAVPRDQWPPHLRHLASIDNDTARPLRAQGLYVRGGQIVRPIGDLRQPELRELVARERLDRADIRRWLDGSIGSPWSGWILLMTPAGIIGAALLRSRLVDPIITSLPIYSRRDSAALVELVKFLGTLVAGSLLALSLASVLTALGMDARDSIFGSFDQRNTLIVAIVMGFAIIPIIYTISEDSLSAVPGQLRSASLGCGATKWQTATRVVLPIAMSGIFSACMIGLGRAAGETMIVLMSTGNTPNMDWNIFSGFRTLAANIATEMPEAPAGSTHYRVLFLGALCLFVLTFIVNTAAEVVRQRVRRKGAGL
ncbi:MAG: ABC transporter permease subunit [Phycisphaeraceae bacterium]|nr:ABC transporter permease subunit [Phycisphaeraceae bacterium]